MRPPVALTVEQKEVVRIAASTLRLDARDHFLLDLSGELSRCRYPVTDLDLRVAIRKLLGIGVGQVT
jgi:hypothetical protein